MSKRVDPVRGMAPERLDWVDTAKGCCIVLVVLMHVIAGFEVAQDRTSWIDPLIEWARLFRMPAFFMLSGLFASRLVERSWPDFLDRKILPFVYFYLVWLAINCLLKFQSWGEGDALTLLGSLALGLIQPFGILWFIYLLAIFFAVTKALRRHPVSAWLVAAALAVVPTTTGWLTLDQFTKFYVYFLSGALFAPLIFRMAAWIDRKRGAALALWLTWAVGSFIISSHLGADGLNDAYGAALVLSHAGALGLIAFAALLAGRLSWLDYCGRNSLPIYLAFFIPMALSRVLLIKTGLPFDVGMVSLPLTVLCVVLPLALQRAVAGSALGFLFVRPRGFRLPRRRMQGSGGGEVAASAVNAPARR